jgi:hypothetical protein
MMTHVCTVFSCHLYAEAIRLLCLAKEQLIADRQLEQDSGNQVSLTQST